MLLSRRWRLWVLVAAWIAVLGTGALAGPPLPYDRSDDGIGDANFDPGDPGGGDGDADGLLVYAPYRPPEIEVVRVDDEESGSGATERQRPLWDRLEGVLAKITRSWLRGLFDR